MRTPRWFGRPLLLVASVTVLCGRWFGRAISLRRSTGKPFRALTWVAVLALAGLVWTAVPASAGPLVDPSTLQPPPPPGAECRLDGQWIICRSQVVFEAVNEPNDFHFACGDTYETFTEVLTSTRWYNANDLKLVKKFVTEDVDGTWSLSPTGAGPTVQSAIHASWWVYYAVPGDESTGAQTTHGEFRLWAPGYGVIVHVAGLDLPDGTHHGLFRVPVPEDPEVAAELCAALTA
jgi:hypothetical protein